jgi:hypothetical protein
MQERRNDAFYRKANLSGRVHSIGAIQAKPIRTDALVDALNLAKARHDI